MAVLELWLVLEYFGGAGEFRAIGREICSRWRCLPLSGAGGICKQEDTTFLTAAD